MNETPDSIRANTLDIIATNYMKIFWLDDVDRNIVYRNIASMDDTQLGKELLYIQEFTDSVNRSEQKWLINLLHAEEENEKINLNSSLTLNF